MVYVRLCFISAEIERNFIECFNDRKYVTITAVEKSGHFQGDICPLET